MCSRSRLHNKTAKSSSGASSSSDRPYVDPSFRPSFRKGVVDQVFEDAKRASPDGQVRDPVTKEVIKWKPGQQRKGVWDMGHKPGHEYSKTHKKYLDGKITKEQLVDRYNDARLYRPESPKTNRSRITEERIGQNRRRR